MTGIIRFLLGWAGLVPPQVLLSLTSHRGPTLWPASQACLLFGSGICWARPDPGAEAEGEAHSCREARGLGEDTLAARSSGVRSIPGMVGGQGQRGLGSG